MPLVTPPSAPGMDGEPLAARLVQLRDRVATAARSGGRPPESVTLVAVTKNVAAAGIAAAHAAGVRHFGENRVAEAEAKRPGLADLAPRPTWHLIGHLQRNKARRALALFDGVDSLDSPRLADVLERLAAESERVVAVLVEVNTSGEASKHGVAPGEVDALADHVVGLPHLRLEGLMTVGPLMAEPEAVVAAFQRLAALRAALARRLPRQPLARLSMGMSDDFELAVAAGATEVRLGRALFAP